MEVVLNDEDIWINDVLLKRGSNWINDKQSSTFINDPKYQQLLNSGKITLTVPPETTKSDSAVDVAETHCFLCLGQSNSEGYGPTVDGNYDYSSPDILQYPGNGTYEKKLIVASEPLMHRTGANTGCIGFHLGFARLYTAVTGFKVILIPCAWGGTGFSSGTHTWTAGNPGGDLYEYAIANTLKLLDLNSKYVLKGVLWHQGETDAGFSAYAASLDAMISGMRARLGLLSLPFIVGELVPSWILGNTDRQAINDILKQTPNRVLNTYCVSSEGLTPINSGGSESDKIHFSAASQRALSERYFNGFYSSFVASQSPSKVRSLQASGIQTNSFILSWQSDFASTWEVTYGLSNGTQTTVTTRVKYLTLSALTPSTVYTVSVKAVNRIGKSIAVTTLITTLAIVAVTIPTPAGELLFEDNFNNTGSGGSGGAPINQGVTIVTDTTRGKVGQFSTSGSDNIYIDANTVLSGQYTKAAWVKLTSASSTTNPNIVSYLGSSQATQNHAFLVPGATGVLSAGYSSSSTYSNVVDTSSFSLNVWTHVAAVQTSDTLKLYKNGVLISSTSVTFNGATKVFVGDLSATAANTSWRGFMDKVQIWGQALTDQQILTLYNQG